MDTVHKKRKPRVLVLKPAGATYDHDRVHSYRHIGHGTYANVGDMLVHESTLMLLDYDLVEDYDVSVLDEKALARANEHFDYAILRGSNFIHEFMDWEAMPDILDRLEIPIFAVGIGAQAATRRKMVLPDPARRVLSAMSDRCITIGVRGEYTAQVLSDNGIHNSEIIGCPTMFRSRDPLLRLRGVTDWPRKVAMSLRRETDKQYARDIGRYLEIQKQLMLRLDSTTDLRVTIHGEPAEKSFIGGDEQAIEHAIDELRGTGWLDAVNEGQILDIYREHLFLYQSGEEYDAFLKDIDLTVGYRVHGVLPALARGVPSILVDYDERSSELARTLDVPLISEDEAAKAGVRELMTHEGFYTWQQNYPKHYKRMANFLTKNGMLHRM